MGYIKHFITNLYNLKQVIDLFVKISRSPDEWRASTAFMTLYQVLWNGEQPHIDDTFKHLAYDELVAMEAGLSSQGHGKKRNMLFKVRRELLRRKVSHIDAVEVLRNISILCSRTAERKIAYSQLFHALWAGQSFDGHGEGSRIMLALDAAMLFCIENNIPLMTTLVVGRKDRDMTRRDTNKIYECARFLGVDVGPDASAYVRKEAEVARDLVRKDPKAARKT